jgi:hypothetical protein
VVICSDRLFIHKHNPTFPRICQTMFDNLILGWDVVCEIKNHHDNSRDKNPPSDCHGKKWQP